MRSIMLLSAVCAVAISTVGCSKGTDASPAAGTSTGAAAEIGVPECDAYMKKYMGCVEDKVPKETRDQLKQSFDAQKAAWKQAAATDEGKKALADACKQADAAAKASMSAFGCSW